MSRVIHKFRLDPSLLSCCNVELGGELGSAKVLLVDNQGGELTIWIEHWNPTSMSSRHIMQFIVLPTGGSFNCNYYRHVGSCQVDQHVWHVYEVF